MLRGGIFWGRLTGLGVGILSMLTLSARADRRLPSNIPCELAVVGGAYFEVSPRSVSPVFALDGNPSFLVARGTSATVFEIKPRDNPAFPAKIYEKTMIRYMRGEQELPPEIIFRPREKRDRDLALINLFKRDADAGMDLGFSIPEAKPIDRKRSDPEEDRYDPHYRGIEYRGIKIGRSAAAIILDPHTPELLRSYIKSENERRFGQLTRYLQTNCNGRLNTVLMSYAKDDKYDPILSLPFVIMDIDLVFSPSSKTSARIFIKSDGVIIDPDTLEAFLVDPD